MASRLNQIFHPQVSGGLEMNDGSVNFEQQTNTYDRTGNLLSSDSNGSLNGVSGGGASNWDQTYTYDGLNRLTGYKRGTYSGGTIASPKFTQTWTLDSVGNWRGFARPTTRASVRSELPRNTGAVVNAGVKGPAGKSVVPCLRIKHGA